MREFKFFKGYVSNLFESIAFPMVRRVGFTLMGDELVQVQPMDGPRRIPDTGTIRRYIPGLNVGQINWIHLPTYILTYCEVDNINLQQTQQSVNTYRTTLYAFLERNANDYIFVYNITDRNNNIYSQDNINQLSGEELVNIRAFTFKTEITI